jgi:hypothetical protein
MPEYTPQLSDEIDHRQLLVEIVQGLLMAHARLDAMEDALKRSVESASSRHLEQFQQELKDVDTRFQRAAGDLGNTLGQLAEVRDQLVLSVEGASNEHLIAFTERLNIVDRDFQASEKEMHKTVESLGRVRDGLVASLEGMSRKHLEAFSLQVEGIQNTIADVHGVRVINLHKDITGNRLTEKTRHDQIISQTKAVGQALDALELDWRLGHLTDTQAAIQAFAVAEAEKQDSNWTYLYNSFAAWQQGFVKSHGDINNSIIKTGKQLNDRIGTVDSELRVFVTQKSESLEHQAKRNAKGIAWLLAFAFVMVCCLGTILYKMFLR